MKAPGRIKHSQFTILKIKIIIISSAQTHLITSRWCKVLKLRQRSRQSLQLRAERGKSTDQEHFVQEAPQAVHTMGFVCCKAQLALS